MILSENEIIDLLPAIFVMDTYVSEGVREASYVLRVASDQLMFEDKVYELGTYPQASSIVINPGKIAVLSTVERLHMPKDLVGKIGIRLQYALQGLTGLMGIQVDPRYGEHRGGERLYIRVANLGINPITLYPNDRVFTFELHQLTSEVKNDKYLNKDITWDVLRRNLPGPQDASWSYASRINDETRQRERQYQRRFNRQIAGIRDYLQPIVMFGIFLVAVTILGVSLTVILDVSHTPRDVVPEWIKQWGWILILATVSIATIATAVFGGLACYRIARDLWGNETDDLPGAS